MSKKTEITLSLEAYEVLGDMIDIMNQDKEADDTKMFLEIEDEKVKKIGVKAVDSVTGADKRISKENEDWSV